MKLGLFLIIVFMTCVYSQNILTVGPGGSGGYTTINEAYSAATAGDTIKVYPGTYYELLIVTKRIHLIGLDTTAVISFTTNGAVYFNAGSDGSSISGFTLRKPVVLAAGVKNIVIAANIFDSCAVNGNITTGGAIIMKNLFRNGTISLNNTGTEKIVIYDNDFTQSVNTITCITAAGNVIISNNTFNGGATAMNLGSGSRAIGNRIKNVVSSGIRLDNTGNVQIIANSIKTINSPGIQVNLFSNSGGSYNNVAVLNNYFNCGTKFAFSMSISTQNSQNSPFSYNAKYLNNVVHSSAGVFELLTNYNRGHLVEASSSFIISNSIIMNCADTFIPRSFITAEHSCFYNNSSNNNVPGVNNIYLNPAFVNAQNDDFHLQPGSPCIDAGTNIAGHSDLDRSRADMGIYGGSYSWDNIMTNGGSRAVELVLNPAGGAQGSTITIAGFGLADVLQNLSEKFKSFDNLLNR